MITVYAYGATTKEYLGTTQAQESPLEKGIVLMPANSTKVPPPSVIGEKQAAVWNSSGWWDVVTDLRGTVYYDADGKEYTQKELGDLPEWALFEKPVIPEPEKTVFTKLAIRRACRTLGLEGKLNALLEASDEFMSDWTDAQDIDLSDPVLLQALAAGAFTEEEINSIKNSLQ